ncbi:hypothetical protein LCGC14_0757710 [marine sediment metagenome]|uniref:Uncharacterized protein n=1 Tax=marine sediment metagenome TaxID=412755 RepID=A0A0F9SMD1_9ZZZZ
MDSDNLPPGLTPSGIPGNSPEEIAIERVMERVDEMVDPITVLMPLVAERLSEAVRSGPDDAARTISSAVDTVEGFQVILDEALNRLDEVLDPEEVRN